MIWFTADPHYGHGNIIKYCNRPFKDSRDMDDTMRKRHNERVSPKDEVYILGDFGLSSEGHLLRILSSLNGKITILKGSHDRVLKKSLMPTLMSIVVNLRGKERQEITLCHYALRVWPKSHFGAWHLFGHSHGKLPSHGKSFDVGVDSHDFYPWSLDEVEQKMETLTAFGIVDRRDRLEEG